MNQALEPMAAAALPETEPEATQPATTRFSNSRAYAQTFAASAVITCMGFISGILAARLLGPAGRGELAAIILLPTLLTTVGALEIPRSVAFEASKSPAGAPRVIATSFWLAIALGALQALLLVALLPLYLPPDKANLLGASRWFVLYLPAASVTAALMGVDQGRGRFGRFSVFLALPGILYVAAIAVIWRSGHTTPYAFAYGVLASVILAAAFRVAMDGGALVRTPADWMVARRLLSRGLRYYLPAIGTFLLSRSDMFLVVRLLPAQAVGLYAVAQAIAMGQLVTVNPFVHVSFAAVAAEHDPGKILGAIVHHFRLAQLVAVAMAVGTAAAASWGIQLFFGVRFAGATKATLVLIAATALSGMAQVLDQSFRAASHSRPGMISNLLGMSAVFALGVPGCRHYGIDGMAGAVLAGHATNLAILIGFGVLAFHIAPRRFWAFDAQSLRQFRSFAKVAQNRLGWSA
jgi:O-antigen/teichoic acid export membrane protein